MKMLYLCTKAAATIALPCAEISASSWHKIHVTRVGSSYTGLPGFAPRATGNSVRVLSLGINQIGKLLVITNSYFLADYISIAYSMTSPFKSSQTKFQIYTHYHHTSRKFSF